MKYSELHPIPNYKFLIPCSLLLSMRNIITDKVVLTQTGKTMEDWFVMLDQKGALAMSHAGIFSLIGKIKGLSELNDWNRNLLTTTYGWSRGLKERGEKESGFEISVSKTVEVPINELYRAFVDENSRKNWLKEKITIRKARENRSARVKWPDNKTSLSIDFYEKGPQKSQVVIQHLKIENSERAAELKSFWRERVGVLKKLAEEMMS